MKGRKFFRKQVAECFYSQISEDPRTKVAAFAPQIQSNRSADLPD